MEYKRSFYNVVFEHLGHKYIYNTLSTALAQLDEKTYKCILENCITDIQQEFIDQMTQSGFIVEKDVDEYEKYLLFYNNTRFLKTAKAFSITLIPTYNCNLACPYCMQGQNKQSDSINEKDLYRIVNFSKHEIENTEANGIHVEDIYVALYGGEPLLEKRALERFCWLMVELAKEKKCEIHFSMTSNFTLLDDEFIEVIKKYGIITQVSIDGTKEQHDRRRLTKGGKGTYDTIIKNLIKMKNNHLEDHLVIRLNIDRDNIQDAEAMISAVETYSTDIYFGFLDHFKGNNDCFTDCIAKENYSDEISAKLERISINHKFPRVARFGKQSPCTLNCVNKYFVDYKFDIYKCEMVVNNPDMKVGSINQDGYFVPSAGYYHQMAINPDRYAECRDCILLPMCAGGCAGKSYFKYSKGTGRIEKSLCTFKESDLISYLKLYIDSN